MIKRHLQYILFAFIAPILLMTSCSKKTMEQITAAPTYLALGDSYTIGQGVNESERWPNQLKDLIEASGIPMGKVDIIAKTGWTTGNLINAISSRDPENCDMVSLLIGVNNQFQGKPYPEFQLEFDILLQTAIQLAGANNNVFVVSIPDYGVTPFGSNNSVQIAADLDKYNKFMQLQCETLGIDFINITEISRNLGSTDSALAPDNLHPSGYQYSLWVEAILPSAIKILKQ